jgi:hypothetical protein
LDRENSSGVSFVSVLDGAKFKGISLFLAIKTRERKEIKGSEYLVFFTNFKLKIVTYISR